MFIEAILILAAVLAGLLFVLTLGVGGAMADLVLVVLALTVVVAVAGVGVISLLRQILAALRREP